jgi:hypothetical protein
VSQTYIRLLKRRASQGRSVEDIRAIEFTNRTGDPDLRPSVYEIVTPPSEIIRACTEHYAAIPLELERTVTSVHTNGDDQNVVFTDGNPKFEFIKTRHREVELENVAALTRFVERLSQCVRNGESSTVMQDQMIRYARNCIERGDPEWTRIASDPQSKGTRWLRSLGEPESPK